MAKAKTVLSITNLSSEDLKLPIDEVFSKCVKKGMADYYGWNTATTEDYAGIVAAFAKAFGKKPFSGLTYLNYEEALSKQCEQYKQKHKGVEMRTSTIRKRKTVITRLTHYVERNSNGLYVNPLMGNWGLRKKRYYPGGGGKRPGGRNRDKVNKGYLCVPRSLTIQTEAAFAKKVSDNRLDKSGIYIGGLIMLFLGLRPGECCGLKYDDIKEMKSGTEVEYVFYISDQEEVSGRSDGGLKTKNSYRVLPIPSTLLMFINERKDMIRNRSNAPEDIQSCPIVNSEKSYEKECSRDTFSKKITEILRECKMSQETVDYAESEMDKNKMLKGEKEPTTYVLRRNFATVMSGVCRITGDDLKYLMGHEFMGEIDRSHYLDFEIIKGLRRKMDRRHLLDRFGNPTFIIDNKTVTSIEVPKAIIHTNGEAAIDVICSCPEDNLEIDIRERKRAATDDQDNAAESYQRTAATFDVTYLDNVDILSRERIDNSEAYRSAIINALKEKG